MKYLILGNAKSGTTALFYAIASSIGDAKHYFEEPLSSLQSMPANAIAKILFETVNPHEIDICNQLFEKKVAIFLDPRDNLVSRLLYSVAAKPIASNDDLIIKLIDLVERKQKSPSDVNLTEIIHLLQGDKGVEQFINEALDSFKKLREFIKKSNGWFLLSYESFIDRDLNALSKYLGITVNKDFYITKEYSRVTRTKLYGDWKNWFTPGDINLIRPMIKDALAGTLYDDDWQLNQEQKISPVNGTEYISKLVEERRQTFGLQPFKVMKLQIEPLHSTSSYSISDKIACSICGGYNFGPGPNHRMSLTGKAPCCKKCGALERHRILRKIFESFPLGFFDWRNAIQFSHDKGIDENWFRTFEVSIYEGKNSIDLQAINRPDGIFDFISLNHVLESVPDDRVAFAELCRVLSPRGVMQICFGSPMSRETTVELPEPQFEWKAHHLYGRDLITRFRCHELGVNVLAVEEMDPCTGASEVVHFFFKDSSDALRVRAWIGSWSQSAQILD